jgi:hypothetical protein
LVVRLVRPKLIRRRLDGAQMKKSRFGRLS